MAGNPSADQLNAMPDDVPSTTITKGPWRGEIVTGDVAATLREIKERPGRDIVQFGTGQLDRLLAKGLLDELHLWVFPVVASSGDRLLDGLHVSHFRLLDTTRFASGIVVPQLDPHRPVVLRSEVLVQGCSPSGRVRVELSPPAAARVLSPGTGAVPPTSRRTDHDHP